MNSSGKAWAAVGGSLAAVAAWYLIWTNRRFFYVNDITTGESVAYPELRSRVYYADVPKVMLAAEVTLRSLPGWRLLKVDKENDALDVEATRGSTSDVTVYVIAIGHSQTRVTIRSRSRSGVGDWGRNAANIRQLQSAMDSRLNTDAAF